MNLNSWKNFLQKCPINRNRTRPEDRLKAPSEKITDYFRCSAVEPSRTHWGVGNSSVSSGYPPVETHGNSHSVGKSSGDNYKHWRCSSLEPPSSCRTVETFSPSDSHNSKYPPADPQQSSSRTLKSTSGSDRDSEDLRSSTFQPNRSRTELRSTSCNGEDLEEDGKKKKKKQRLDAELLMKKKRLREMEEQILKIKASIGMETAAPSRLGSSLRVRVMELLHQRHPPLYFSKADKTRLNLSNKESRHHPLKLRVKALMEMKEKDPSALLAFRNQAPPTLSTSSSTQSATGFERFLNILNRGVDLSLLSRIVTDDTLELPEDGGVRSVRGPRVEDAPGGGATSPNSGTKREEEEEEEPRKVDEQQEQLKDVLKALGMSLEADELSRLSERTQERLYGRRSQSRAAPESHSSRVHSPPSPSPSPSSSSSSSSRSRSTSRSSRSRSRRRRSRSGSIDGKKWRTEGPPPPSQPLHPHPQPPPSPHGALFSGYSSSQYFQYTAPSSYWPPSPMPPSPFGVYRPEGPSDPGRRHELTYENNPDLAASEGQSSVALTRRCLTSVSVQPDESGRPTPPNADPGGQSWKKWENWGNTKRPSQKKRRKRFRSEIPLRKEETEERIPGKHLGHPPPPIAENKPKKSLQTEEEIKTNLREKLEAFNQKMKNKGNQPGSTAAPPPLTASSLID